MKPVNFPRRREQRKREATERQNKWELLSDSQKLESLRKRGHGHCKQARKLEEKLNVSV